MIVNFSTWCFSIFKTDSSQAMAQNISYSPWERNKGPWLRYYLVSFDCFPLFPHFSFLSLNLFFAKFSTDKRQAEDMV